MPRSERCHEFLFAPRDFINDPAVLEMDECEVGAYVILLCQLWDLNEPGVVQDDDRILARLSRTSPEAWKRYRPRISRCFDTTSRPGWWIQKRMVSTKRIQDTVLAGRSAGGKARAQTAVREGDGTFASSRHPAGIQHGNQQDIQRDPAVPGSRFPVPGSQEERVKGVVPATRSRFTPPTLAEVTEHCRARKSTVDPEAFMAHYQSNGWRVGKNPMKSWKDAVVTWEKNRLANGNSNGHSHGDSEAEVARLYPTIEQCIERGLLPPRRPT